MIIPEHKIVFLHIPKTGGSSIDNFLFKYYKIPNRSFLYFTLGFLALPSYKDTKTSTLYNVCHFPYLDTLRIAKNSNIITGGSCKSASICTIASPFACM